jgi:hypothetical protein
MRRAGRPPGRPALPIPPPKETCSRSSSGEFDPGSRAWAGGLRPLLNVGLTPFRVRVPAPALVLSGPGRPTRRPSILWGPLHVIPPEIRCTTRHKSGVSGRGGVQGAWRRREGSHGRAFKMLPPSPTWAATCTSGPSSTSRWSAPGSRTTARCAQAADPDLLARQLTLLLDGGLASGSSTPDRALRRPPRVLHERSSKAPAKPPDSAGRTDLAAGPGVRARWRRGGNPPEVSR